MSSTQICDIMEKQILTSYGSAEVVKIPVADGGEGSVDAFLKAVGGERITVSAKDPYMQTMDGFYGMLSQQKNQPKTAIIEMAAVAGLPLVGDNLHPDKTTTFGVGQLILAAIEAGAKKIIVGLGGSATNDAGCGAASALGVQFYNKSGEIFVPTGGTLCNIDKIDVTHVHPSVKQVEILCMCDIDNPLFGKNGAAYVFAPQKGADSNMVQSLDDGLIHFANVLKTQLQCDVANLPGAGAAGGMGGGLTALFNAKLQMGIEVILNITRFDSLLNDADLVFTGEGKIDSQSLRGKVVVGVARYAKKRNVPVIAVVGDIEDPIDAIYAEGVSAVYSINRVAVPFSQAKTRAVKDLTLTMNTIMRTLGLFF
jgi:glycerate kinase